MPTLTSFERTRLLQAVVFFASNVEALGKVKLFKLLYLFDFEHFRQTGKSATGLDYQAWKMGPVPVELMDEWEDLSPDLSQLIRIEAKKVINFERQTVVLNEGVQFNPEPFSPRQLRILTRLAGKYHKTLSGSMIDITHEENGAWAKTWSDGDGLYKQIPYEISIENGDELATVRDIAKEQSMYRAALAAARHVQPE